jgi:hypothetical protein
VHGKDRKCGPGAAHAVEQGRDGSAQEKERDRGGYVAGRQGHGLCRYGPPRSAADADALAAAMVRSLCGRSCQQAGTLSGAGAGPKHGRSVAFTVQHI